MHSYTQDELLDSTSEEEEEEEDDDPFNMSSLSGDGSASGRILNSAHGHTYQSLQRKYIYLYFYQQAKMKRRARKAAKLTALKLAQQDESGMIEYLDRMRVMRVKQRAGPDVSVHVYVFLCVYVCMYIYVCVYMCMCACM